MGNTLLHMASKAHWANALAAGTYEVDTLKIEGFIHCSTRDTILKVANKWYRGRTDLVLLCIDESLVVPEVKWEGPYGGDYYPHIYGPLNLDAVTAVLEFAPDRDGSFRLPPEGVDL